MAPIARGRYVARVTLTTYVPDRLLLFATNLKPSSSNIKTILQTIADANNLATILDASLAETNKTLEKIIVPYNKWNTATNAVNHDIKIKVSVSCFHSILRSGW